MDQTAEGVSAGDSFHIQVGCEMLELCLTTGLMIGQHTMGDASASVLHPKAVTSNSRGTTKWFMVFVNSVMSIAFALCHSCCPGLCVIALGRLRSIAPELRLQVLYKFVR